MNAFSSRSDILFKIESKSIEHCSIKQILFFLFFGERTLQRSLVLEQQVVVNLKIYW